MAFENSEGSFKRNLCEYCLSKEGGRWCHLVWASRHSRLETNKRCPKNSDLYHIVTWYIQYTFNFTLNNFSAKQYPCLKVTLEFLIIVVRIKREWGKIGKCMKSCRCLLNNRVSGKIPKIPFLPKKSKKCQFLDRFYANNIHVHNQHACSQQTCS